MDLVQCRIVSDDVEGLAGFYARLLGAPTALNEYYVEIQAGPGRDNTILDFLAADVDAEHRRIAALGVDWMLLPTTQPWGNRSMMFRDPAGNLLNVFSRPRMLLWMRDARGHDDDAGVGPGALTAALIEAPGRVLRGFRVPWSLAPPDGKEMTMHDHRRLGRELELFDTDPLIGAGLPYWLPAAPRSGTRWRSTSGRSSGGPATSMSTPPCSASASCTRSPGTGRTTGMECTRRWTSAASRWCCGPACARITR